MGSGETGKSKWKKWQFTTANNSKYWLVSILIAVVDNDCFAGTLVAAAVTVAVLPRCQRRSKEYTLSLRLMLLLPSFFVVTALLLLLLLLLLCVIALLQ